MRPLFLKEFLKRKFGEVVYKIPLDPGFACPHGRCIYCDLKGSAAPWIYRGMTIRDQMMKGAMLIAKRYKVKKFIAYFQAYTTTNASIDALEKLYSDVLKFPGVVGLAISTRPDSIDDKILELIADFSKRTFVWIELGAQSMYDSTLEWINRGHTVNDFIKGVNLVHKYDLPVVGHLIFGLPVETPSMMLNSFTKMMDLGIWGFKIHMLHVIAHTPLAKLYKESPFKLLSSKEFIDLVVEAICLAPKQSVIHRVTGETNSYKLIAPQWVLDKQNILNKIKAKINKKCK